MDRRDVVASTMRMATAFACAHSLRIPTATTVERDSSNRRRRPRHPDVDASRCVGRGRCIEVWFI